MKYAAAVLFNNKNSLSTVNFAAVTDALLAGGVFLDEVVFLPYDAPSSLSAALLRLSAECDGVFLVCDRPLIAGARTAVEQAVGRKFTEEWFLDTKECLFAVLPAGKAGEETVKAEMPRIDARRKQRYSRVVVCTVCAPAQLLRTAMAAASEAAAGKLYLHLREEYGVARIEVLYDSETPKMIADEVIRVLAATLGEYVYSLEDKSISVRLFEALKLHRFRVSTAESFTAGGVGQAIVSNPGASAVFFEGLNTYDSRSKEKRLGIPAYILRSKGAVSDDTAYQMAAGLIKQGDCDLAIATTGVAGPEPDGDKPVGLCYIAIGTRERVRVYCHRLSGDRETITRTAVNCALYHAFKDISS